MPDRVLVVDDDPLTLEILATILDLEEFEVSTATDGDAALELARAEDFRVVLLDVMMPGRTGLEVCAELKADPETRNTPVILLTAKASTSDRSKGLDAGADAYLTKPFSPLALIDTIRSLGVA